MSCAARGQNRFFPHGGSVTFYGHLPRTGGTWIKRALETCKLRVKWKAKRPYWLSMDHSCLSNYRHDQFNDVGTFVTFVRHPKSYYESIWRWMDQREKGRRGLAIDNRFAWEPRLAAARNYDPDFNVWADRMLKLESNWITRLYETYVGPEGAEFFDYIGRTETITQDFLESLYFIGREKEANQFRERIIEMGVINKTDKESDFVWDPHILRRMLTTERIIINRFYSPENSGKRRFRFLQQDVVDEYRKSRMRRRNLIRMKKPRESLVEALRGEFGDTGPRRGVEVGVWKGENCCHLLLTFPGLTMWGVDHYPEDHFIKTFDDTTPDLAYKLMLENLAQFGSRMNISKTSSAATAPGFPDKSVEFVYLDADHSYEGVKQDLNLWHSKIVSGGLLCGDDYGGKGDRMRRNPFGVKRAVDEFAKEKGWEVRLHGARVWSLVIP